MIKLSNTMKNSFFDGKIKIQTLENIKSNDLHIVKFIDKKKNNYYKFGELYGSYIEKNEIKAWKIQKKNTMNLFIPFGKVKIVCSLNNKFLEFILSSSNHKSLFLKPGIFYGFKGLNKKSLILNLIDDIHNDSLIEKKPLTFFNYNW